VGAAFADVFVFGDVTKEKDISIQETLLVNKVIDVAAVVLLPDISKAANSDVIVNQVNMANEACTNCAEKKDTLQSSANNNSGVLSVNQSGGNNNNQGNAVSVAVDARTVTQTPPPPPVIQADDAGFAMSQVAVEQTNGVYVNFTVDVVRDESTGRLSLGGLTLDDLITPSDLQGFPIPSEPNTVQTTDILFRDALLEDSANDNAGVAHINQATGNMNNQANVASVSVSLASGGVALAEAKLGQINALNLVFESDAVGITDPATQPDLLETYGVNKSATISGSVLTNAGIVGVNQTVGNFANQTNAVSFSAVGAF
jgi:hypothetical protein